MTPPEAIFTTLDTPPHGEIVAENIAWEDYLTQFEGHYEWVKGYVIRMSPIQERHFRLVTYLLMLFNAYFAHRPIGQVLGDPFVMKLENLKVGRQPDLQIILNTNHGQLTPTAMIGPANICIEVVSPSSVAIDYDEKFREYQAGGVREYWILDYQRRVGDFHRLNSSGKYEALKPDPEGIYQTALLPAFQLHVSTLWQETLPSILDIVASVQTMLTSSE